MIKFNLSPSYEVLRAFMALKTYFQGSWLWRIRYGSFFWIIPLPQELETSSHVKPQKHVFVNNSQFRWAMANMTVNFEFPSNFGSHRLHSGRSRYFWHKLRFNFGYQAGTYWSGPVWGPEFWTGPSNSGQNTWTDQDQAYVTQYLTYILNLPSSSP